MTIYLDNATTSKPKPECVYEAMLSYMRHVGASPGRSGHRLANAAEGSRFDTREAIAELFGISDPKRVIFTLNATTALNVVIQGLLPPGSHALTTAMEHNAVLRPLRALERRGVQLGIVPCEPDGTLDPARIDEYLRPQTGLLVVNHASNVCGTILPIREIGARARELGIPFLIDAAQTAGVVPIDMYADHVDLLAFCGHKGLLGPSGTGGLVIRDDFDTAKLPPLVRGGTGSASEHEGQPDVLPDKYEAGTPNTAGIAGLGASVRYILERGVERIQAHERGLTRRLIDGLRRIAGVRVYGTLQEHRQTTAVSFTIAGHSVSDFAHRLDERFGIMCRPGLHCAPQAHRTLGTLPAGTLRFAHGPFSTEREIDEAVKAVAILAGERTN